MCARRTTTSSSSSTTRFHHGRVSELRPCRTKRKAAGTAAGVACHRQARRHAHLAKFHKDNASSHVRHGRNCNHCSVRAGLLHACASR